MAGRTTFAKQVISNRGELVYLVQGNSGKRDYWCLVMVERAKLDRFKRNLGGSIRIQDYGTVLNWGYGSQPPDSREYNL